MSGMCRQALCSEHLKGTCSGECLSVAFSPCGTMIASGGRQGPFESGTYHRAGCDCVLKGHSGVVRDVCWLATGNKSSRDQMIVQSAYGMSRRNIAQRFLLNTPSSDCCRILARFIFGGFRDGTVKVYDSQSGDIIQAISNAEA
jgi:WD40 repeat protein